LLGSFREPSLKKTLKKERALPRMGELERQKETVETVVSRVKLPLAVFPFRFFVVF
jgi:hypothetical protein